MGMKMFHSEQNYCRKWNYYPTPLFMNVIYLLLNVTITGMAFNDSLHPFRIFSR